jgi:Ca-activated chloride channel family protein
MSKVFALLFVFVCAIYAHGQEITQGSLLAAARDGKELGSCPLKSTAVKSEISGFLARVNVRQEFTNEFDQPIEAVYVFPLSQNGAVDDMTMHVGERIVRAKIMKRDEARKTYDAAKSQGKTASLLDQERPNIFTQSVANIMPGDKVVIEISYVETLKYEDGSYEFVFPMTVGPRYIPGEGVKDAANIKPPIAATRNGSDISIEVNLNAGVPVEEIRSNSHDVDQINYAPNLAKVSLKGGTTIPNKDFILRYDVTGGKIQDALLTHRDERGGFFTLILQPPDKIATEDRTPKEIVFVLDTSGSMYGFPIDKAKEAMKLSLDGLYPEDTFNLITFAGDTSVLFDKPVPATQSNLEKAQAFLDSRQGGGGTEMMKAIKAALDPSDAQDHLRIVCFMTDGYVGNEEQIIGEVQRHPNARVFSFGIGSSVNRYLLDKMAEAGKGEVEYVTLDDDGSKAAKKFYERVRTPLLTDLSVDWNGMPVADVYPGRLTDLFSAKPVILHGRYTKAASGTIRLRGKVAGQEYVREIKVNLPESETANDSLASLWARTRVDELSSNKLNAAPTRVAEIENEIASLGLEFRLLTALTSFVAVEERVVNPNGNPTTVQVPVNIPEGVDPRMAAGDQDIVRVGDVANLPLNGRQSVNNPALKLPPPSTQGNKTFEQKYGVYGDPNSRSGGLSNSSGSGGGTGQGSGSGSGSGNGTGRGSGGGGGGGNTVNSTSSVVTVTAAASVDVTSDEPVKTDDSKGTKVETTISRRQVEELPKGTTYTSLLRTTANKRAEPLPGQYSINGSTGPENGFVIDGAEVDSFRVGSSNSNKTPLTGRAVAVAEPVYPDEARAAKAKGKVLVNVTLDREGSVVSAKAVSGNKYLREPAEAAAMLSKFAPVYVEGHAVTVTGTILYEFKDANKTEIFVRQMKAQPLSEDDKRAIQLSEKLHSWIYQLMTWPRDTNLSTNANFAAFVKDGKASIRVSLKSGSPAVIEKLRRSGMEIDSTKGKDVTGRIAVEKIADVAAIDDVVYVFPKI